MHIFVYRPLYANAHPSGRTRSTSAGVVSQNLMSSPRTSSETGSSRPAPSTSKGNGSTLAPNARSAPTAYAHNAQWIPVHAEIYKIYIKIL